MASTLIAVISFAFNGWIIPQSNRSRLAFELQYFNNKYFFDKRNVHMQMEPNIYFYMQNTTKMTFASKGTRKE